MLRLFVALLTLLSLALAQNTLVGRASVVDEDTLEVQGVRIRLWGVDAVESSQTCLDASGKPWPCGRRAAFALADFLGQRTVRCERRDTDRYGRLVAVCSVGGVEINRWLVEQGWALAYVRYGGSVYLEAQRQAQALKRGIWQGRFTPPWEYRRNPANPPSAGAPGSPATPPSNVYKKEGVWGSYKAPHFNGGIHGLPHVRLRRKRIRSAAIMRSRAGEGRGQGREDQKGPPRDEGTQKRAEACRLSA